MDYQVLISPRAREDLRLIVRYISQDNPDAASRLGHFLIEKALSLQDLPLRGRVVPELNESSIREIVFRSYRIIYEVSEEKRMVAILRYWHAARGTLEIR